MGRMSDEQIKKEEQGNPVKSAFFKILFAVWFTIMAMILLFIVVKK